MVWRGASGIAQDDQIRARMKLLTLFKPSPGDIRARERRTLGEKEKRWGV